jgi:DNA-binding NtrC family response regulator
MTARAFPPVLIVDDDSDLRDTMKMILEIEGYSVSVATNSADALAYLRAASVGHVVLLDFLIPKVKGEVLGAVQQEEPLQRHAYLLNSGYPPAYFAPEELLVISEVCLRILEKPFEIDEFLDAISAATAQLARNRASAFPQV